MSTLSLPPSVLTKRQTRTYGPKPINGYGKGALIRAKVRHDDECGNGHNSFSITGTVYIPGRRDIEAGGCMHEEIAKHFPELAPFIKWHLMGTDGPMHYASNTLYHASDRDHNGLRKGERRHSVSGRTGLAMWELVAVNAPGVSISGTSTGEGYKGNETVPLFILETRKQAESTASLPPIPVLRWEPSWTVGEGKKRELQHARSSAVWPEVTDEELIRLGDMPRAEAEAILNARLPALMAEFRAAVESLGFVY